MAGQAHPVSPLALPLPEMPPVPGVRVATGMAEIRYRAREDVMVMAFPAGTTAAGVFTKNRCPARRSNGPAPRSMAAARGGSLSPRAIPTSSRARRAARPASARRPRPRASWAANRVRCSSPPPA